MSTKIFSGPLALPPDAGGRGTCALAYGRLPPTPTGSRSSRGEAGPLGDESRDLRNRTEEEPLTRPEILPIGKHILIP